MGMHAHSMCSHSSESMLTLCYFSPLLSCSRMRMCTLTHTHAHAQTFAFISACAHTYSPTHSYLSFCKLARILLICSLSISTALLSSFALYSTSGSTRSHTRSADVHILSFITSLASLFSFSIFYYPFTFFFVEELIFLKRYLKKNIQTMPWLKQVKHVLVLFAFSLSFMLPTHS